ncbi:MAG: ABC transporter permease [Chloroflexi bacterium]|nr:ABC transporter permease [Chloroflexota bacterium]
MAGATAEVLKVRRVSRPRALWRPLRENAIEGLALLGGVLLWEACGWLLPLPWLPPFSHVVAALAQFIESGVIGANVAVSLQGLAIGFGFSLVVGLTVGALMGRYRRVEQALDVYVYAMLLSPSMVFAPIFFAIFGLSDMARIAVIVMYALFVIIINTSTGVRTVDPALVEMARSFGAGERQLFLRILLPASLPLVFAGIRLGMGRAVKGMINGEMFIALVGLGALAQKYGSQFEASKVFAIALVVLIVALFANWIVQIIEQRLTRWAD